MRHIFFTSDSRAFLRRMIYKLNTRIEWKRGGECGIIIVLILEKRGIKFVTQTGYPANNIYCCSLILLDVANMQGDKYSDRNT